MKVALFQFYPATLWTPGGGETQLHKTREALQKQGVDAILFDLWSPRRDFDILHVFGSSYQLSDFVVTAKRLGMRVVVSPISYTDKAYWQWLAARVISWLLPVPTTYTYRKRLYEAADVLVSGSRAEAQQLQRNFAIDRHKFRVVYNAADKSFAEARPDAFVRKFGLTDFVLMVGRINRRKGQLRLLKALEGTGLQLVFIGEADPDDLAYFQLFQQAVRGKPWVHYLSAIRDRELLASAYAAARVHALPSYGEFPGLVSLEAGLAGANVVAVRDGPVYEHLGDEVWYCNPSSARSIRDAVLSAYRAPKDGRLRNRLLPQFTWDTVAQQLIQIYEELL